MFGVGRRVLGNCVKSRGTGSTSSLLKSKRKFSSTTTGSKALFSNQAAISAVVGITTLLLLGSGSSKAEPVVVVEEKPVQVGIDDEKCQSNIESKLGDVVNDLQNSFKSLLAVYHKCAEIGKTNEAFVFIKPHAVTEKVDELVQDHFKKVGIQVTESGELTHDVIDENKLIDTHYGAIASKAVILKPSELVVPEKGQAGFDKMFGLKWTDAVEQGKVYNAADAAKKLGLSSAELDEKWGTLKRGENLIKFGGGFYCGKVDDIYVINGFYMSMRDKFCVEPAKIKYYIVNWKADDISWKQFREEVLGGTDPTEAVDGSLRRTIYQQWKDLGLTEVPNVGDNGLHASASPLEATAEKINWTGRKLEDDKFGAAMLEVGITKDTVLKWMEDPQVVQDGENHSMFDLCEDRDSFDLLVQFLINPPQ